MPRTRKKCPVASIPIEMTVLMIKEDSMMSPLPEKSEPFAGLQKVNIYISIYERPVKVLALNFKIVLIANQRAPHTHRTENVPARYCTELFRLLRLWPPDIFLLNVHVALAVGSSCIDNLCRENSKCESP